MYMNRLYQMATNPEEWPISKIYDNWTSYASTSSEEFHFLNTPDVGIPNLSGIISKKQMTEDEIRMYMLFAWHFCNDNGEA